jgi:hypothetical protein
MRRASGLELTRWPMAMATTVEQQNPSVTCMGYALVAQAIVAHEGVGLRIVRAIPIEAVFDMCSARVTMVIVPVGVERRAKAKLKALSGRQSAVTDL